MRNGESGPLSLCLTVRKNFLMAGDVQNESGMSSPSIGLFKQNLETGLIPQVSLPPSLASRILLSPEGLRSEK